jgi:hypothetical protein
MQTSISEIIVGNNLSGVFMFHTAGGVALVGLSSEDFNHLNMSC